MKIIHTLEPSLIAFLAAGEVVERPVSVLKELVENAIDSGASKIEIEYQGGGIDLIRVQDNGFGMSYADLEICLNQHTTSKTFSLNDVKKPSSLGFRGEALFSIASVSDIEIESGLKNASESWKLVSKPSITPTLKPCQRVSGTRVSVYNLFRNIPARKAFLKSVKIESSHLVEYIKRVSLLYPEISFSITKASTRECIFSSYSSSFVPRSVSVLRNIPDFQADIVFSQEQRFLMNGQWKIDFVLIPVFDKRKLSSWKQVVSIDGRLVRVPWMNTLISNSYFDATGKREQYFEYVIRLSQDISTSMVDVNVHPRKIEVRISNENLLKQNLHSLLVSYFREKTSISTISIPRVDLGNEILADSSVLNRPLGIPVGQIGNSWIISDANGDMLIIDQHAAHERIILESLKKKSEWIRFVPYKLKKPIFITDDISIMVFIEHNMAELTSLGFEFELDTCAVYLKSIPWAASISDSHFNIAHDIISSFSSYKHSLSESSLEGLLIDYAKRACKSAIKFGDKLTMSEMDSLLRSMEKTPAGMMCCHGRPTVYRLDDTKLRSLFER